MVINEPYSEMDYFVKELLKQLPMYIFWKDKAGVFLGCNESFARSVGLSNISDVIGKTDYDLPFRKEENEAFIADDQEVMASDSPKMNIEETQTYPDGRQVILLTSKIPLHNNKGEVVGVLGICSDITERKKMEKALELAKEQAESVTAAINKLYLDMEGFVSELLKQLPTYVFWKDKAGIYLGCNELFAHSLGLKSVADIVGKTDYDLPTTKEESDAFRADDQQVINSNCPKINIEETQTFPDGKQITLLTSKVPLRNKNGEVIGVLGIYSDITERKKMERELQSAKDQAEAANKAKSAFIANISHDVRLPLTGVIGVSDMMIADEKQRTAANAELIKQSGNSLLLMMNKILDFVKIESPDLKELEKEEPFSIESMINDTVSLYMPATKSKNLDLHAEIDKTIPEVLLSRPGHIYKIINNLVGNAIKFTSKGEVVIAASFEQTDANPCLVLKVRDTGIGVPAEKRSVIFDWFERLTPAYKGVYQGTGLGLAMVKQAIDFLQGTIEVTDNAPNGTIFICKIPVKIPASLEGFKSKSWLDQAAVHEANMLKNNPIKLQANTSIQEENLAGENNKLLLVEDDVTAGYVAKNFLERVGYTVTIAANGEEAITKVKKFTYDLMVCDIGLPDMSGFDLVKKCREMGLECPIFALTGHADMNQNEFLNAGFSAVLIKPLDLKKFKKHLASAQNSEEEKEEEKEGEERIFDLSLAIKRSGVDRAFTFKLLGMYLENLPQDLILLKEAENANDVILVREILHRMRGSASYCGVTRFSTVMAEVHEEVKQKNGEGLATTLKPLYQVAALTIEEIKKHT